jgi:hypothetical protein
MRKITFNKYSGLRIKGETPIGFESHLHLDLASYITTQVESGGVYGTVMNYDKTGMTAGSHQAIAVYPKFVERGLKSQGPLWKLLSRMMSLDPTPLALVDIVELMFDNNLSLGEDGRVRYLATGAYAAGESLLEFFGTPDGLLINQGEGRKRAENLIQLFHDLFSTPSTFKLQERLGLEHFVKAAERSKLRFSRVPRTKGTTIQEAVYDCLTENPHHISLVENVDMDSEVNLAMCMFWSYYVNAPGMALKKLCQAVDAVDRRTSTWETDLPRMIVRKLGTSSYGRWDDDIDSGRYQRTRKEMKKHFDAALFRKGAIMPKDFPGA